MNNIRFLQTTIEKMCEAKTSDELHKVYKEAKYGWETAKGEKRGGFTRLQLPQVYISIIDSVFYRLLFLLIEKERLDAFLHTK